MELVPWFADGPESWRKMLLTSLLAAGSSRSDFTIQIILKSFKPTCPLSAGADVAPDMSTTARMIRHIFPNPCQEKLLLSQRWWRFVTVELLDENPPFPQVKKSGRNFENRKSLNAKRNPRVQTFEEEWSLRKFAIADETNEIPRVAELGGDVESGDFIPAWPRSGLTHFSQWAI